MTEVTIDIEETLLTRVMGIIIANCRGDYTTEYGRKILGGIIESALERWLDL